MRGIVAEVNGKHAIILAQDGTFRKVKAAKHWAVGSEIDLSQPAGNVKVTGLVTKVSSIAAAAVLVLGIGYGAYSYAMPYSYVDLDINPSVELTANVYDRIIRVEALNDDGKKLLSSRSLKNTKLQAGITQLLHVAVEQGYLNAGSGTAPDNSGSATGNAVLFTVSSTDGKKSEELKKELTDTASKELDKGSVKSEVLSGEASVQQRNEAKKFGVTPGKLALIEDAIEDEPELKLEDLKKAAVKDLIKKARDKKSTKEDQQGNDGKGKKNSSVESDKGDSRQENEADQMNQDSQGIQQEQTSVMGQRFRQQDDSDKNEGSAQNSKSSKGDKKKTQNDQGDKSGKNNKNDKSGKDNTNDKSRQDIADALAREKEQRQKLMDELLEQNQKNEREKEEKQQEKKQQIKGGKESSKQDEDENETQKGKKNGSWQKKRNGAVDGQSETAGDEGSQGKGSGKKQGKQ